MSTPAVLSVRQVARGADLDVRTMATVERDGRSAPPTGGRTNTPAASPPALPVKFLLEEIPAGAPDQTWYLVTQPIPISGSSDHKVLLFTIQQPRHAGDDFTLRVAAATLRAPEFAVAKTNLSTWMRHQVGSQRAQEAVLQRDATLAGAFQGALKKTQQRFLPKGSEFTLPQFTDDTARTRDVQVGFFLGGHEAHGVPCASCGSAFSARVGDSVCVMTLRLAPDGPQTTLYWCPRCATPGLSSAGTLNLTVGRDGATLSD